MHLCDDLFFYVLFCHVFIFFCFLFCFMFCELKLFCGSFNIIHGNLLKTFCFLSWFPLLPNASIIHSSPWLTLFDAHNISLMSPLGSCTVSLCPLWFLYGSLGFLRYTLVSQWLWILHYSAFCNLRLLMGFF